MCERVGIRSVGRTCAAPTISWSVGVETGQTFVIQDDLYVNTSYIDHTDTSA